MALVLAGMTAAAATLGLGARGRERLGIAAVLWFVVLTRWEPSVLRAGLMAVLVLAGRLSGRGTEGRHALGMAVLLLLLADPLLAGQLGFLLSVAATAGVLVLGPALAERLRGPVAWRQLAGAAIGAQVGVAPVLLTLPDGIPVAGVAANLVAVPAAAVASALGVAAALGAQFSERLGGLLALVAWPALRAITGTAALVADGPRLTAAGVTLPLLALLMSAVALRRRAPRLALVGVTVTALVAALPVIVPPAGVAVLTVTALDVGQGDAVLVEVPAADGSVARLLVDGGPQPGALAALRARRVRRLDAVVLTHAHADHSDGLPAILRALDVGALIVGPRPLPGRATLSAVQTYATARGRRVPVLAVAAGSRFALGAAMVEVLSPPASEPLSDDVNDESIVLRVVAQGRAALLPGDAEAAAQTFLLRDPAQLRADYLKVPHHGGATNHQRFLAAVGADVNVLSVGRDNDYGHPHPSVLAALAGSTVLRTDHDGSVGVALTPHGARPLHGPSAGVPTGPPLPDSTDPAPLRPLRPPGAVRVRPPRRRGGGAGARGRSRADLDCGMPASSPIMLFVGPEELLLRRAADQLLDERREQARGTGAALEVVDLRAADVRERGLPDLRTASLFGDPRAVVIREAQDLPASASAALLAELDAGMADTTVVLLASGTARIVTLAKRLKADGARIDIEVPRDWEDRKWADLVGAEFRRAGRSADAGAVQAILEHAGLHIATIVEKVAQAVAAVPKGRIGADAVNAVVVGHGDRGTFAVADAMCDRDPAKALSLLRGVLEGGDDPVLVLGALGYRLRSLVAVAGKLDPKSVGLNASPGQLRRLQGVRRNFGPGELTRAYRALADADAEIKGGELSPAFALERAVATVATRT